MEVVYFDKNIQEFIASLQAQAYARTLRTIGLLVQYGHVLTMPHSKHVESRL